MSYHAHECEDCGTVWCHDLGDRSSISDAQLQAAHACPKCGKDERLQMNEFGKPAQFCHNAERTLTLDADRGATLMSECERVYDEKWRSRSILDVLLGLANGSLQLG